MRNNRPGAGWAGTRGEGLGFLMAAACAAAVMGGGCDIFDIRDPVEPIGEEPIPRCNTSIDPDSALCNVETGIQYKLRGFTLYEESLAEDFGLVLDETDAADLGTGVDSLTRAQTVNAQRIQSGAEPDSFSFRFIRDEPDQDFTRLEPGPGVTEYENIRYELRFITVGVDTTENMDKLIRGQADITAVEDDQQQWVIRRWVDGRLPNPAPNQQTLGFWHGSVVVGSSPRPPGVVQ